MLPESLVGPPGLHPKRVRLLREEDLSEGYGRVYLPHASERKYPPAPAGWVWRRIFPAGKLSTGPRSGAVRRRHAPEDMLRAAVKKGAKAASIQKRVSWHTFRHSFAAHLPEAGYDIRTVRGLLGHTSVETTRIYTHALNKGVRGVRSPLGGG